jgi:hypothetical protein
METKYDRDLLAEENFLQSAIQDLILDVYTSGDASGDASKVA